MIKQFAEDTDSETLSAGAIFGIVLACIAGLLALIIIIVAIKFCIAWREYVNLCDIIYIVTILSNML